MAVAGAARARRARRRHRERRPLLHHRAVDPESDDGVKKAKSQIGGLGLLAYALTLGIWTPMHVHLVCAAPPPEQ